MSYPIGLSRLKTQAIIACGIIGIWHSVQGQIIASNDFYIVPEGTPVAVSAPGVLTNDTGGGPLTATLVARPANGTLTFNSNGSFTYTPTNNFTGVDNFTYQASSLSQTSAVATAVLMVVAPGELFYDDFARPTGSGSVFPWTPVLQTNGATFIGGVWGITNNLLIGNSPGFNYGFAYFDTNWTDYSVQAQIRFSVNDAASAGVIGRLNTATTSHYDVWVYPEESTEPLGSGNGTAILRLFKHETWDLYTQIGNPITLPGVGVSWHTVKLTLTGNNISVYFDGNLEASVTDDGSIDGTPAYTNGGFGFNMWTQPSFPYTFSVANLLVNTTNSIANYDAYNATINTTLSVPAPGILANDAGNAPLTATLAGGPTHGSLTLTNNGGFSYTPANGFSGTDRFTYQCSDGQTTSQVATVTLTVNNAAFANNDFYTVSSNTTLNVNPPGVLANDQGGNGPLTVILDTGPAEGSLTLATNGGFSYTPATDFVGLDSFTYQCQDNQSTSQVAVVTINVVTAAGAASPALSFDLTNNASVSNAAFTVTGTTTGGMTVTNVYYQLDGTGWNTAQTTNGWTNWSANVILIPGTNVVQAYAADSLGGVSPTNQVSFTCVISTVLTVTTNGNGTINPNDNGALLQIGKSYSMTAAPGTGFIFTNWTGGTSLPLSFLTNGPTVTFLMASNLMLQANFADVTRPTLSITNITAGMLVSNASFTVMGTATDNVAVASVFYALNNTGWSNAATGNNWSTWTAAVTLTPGTNTIAAYAVDNSGNISTTNTLNFVYVVNAILTVSTNGLGSLNPNYNGAPLQIGKGYSITASPATGFMFTNWTGGTNLPLAVLTNGTTVKFLMVSNLMLQANFVDTIKPALTISAPTSGQRISNAVFTVTGTASDNWQVGNVQYQLNNTGWSNAVTGNGWTNWSAGVTLVPGTNVFLAYAVDTTGNRSTTNSVSFQCVVSAPLQVQLTGLGTLSPNYSNALLAIGQIYTMTATPGTGLIFTNWTGGTSLPLTVLTNGTTLQFRMQSNLVLQANFMDVTKPTLTISAPTSGQRLSNDVFTVQGTASDNWQVSNVWYQLNNTGWTSATGTTNWSAVVDLTQGTNLLLAYAVDTTGNRSTTNSVSFQYVVSAPLQVQITGLGTLSPNYSNAVLAIGTNYTLTATPGTGFRFTNWMGGTSLPLTLLTNGTTVQFRMQSNLILQANFVDIAKPTLTITNLTSGQRVSNAVFTVKGTASDNWQVGNVQYQLNNTGWSNATSGNVWTNWASAAVTLVPGTNVVSAYAVDTSGNLSVTNSVSFQFVVTNQLGVRAVGLGTLNPNYSNAWLEIGRNYSMTATPGSGFMFTNWTLSTNWLGGVKTNNATVQFMMQSNLTLQVGFVDVTRPTLTITAPTAGQRMTNALANVLGTASDNWRVTNVWYQLNTNAWSLATSTNGWTNWTVTLTLVTGTNTVRAYAVDLGSNLSLTNSVSFVSSNSFKLQLGFGAGENLDANGLGFDLQISPGLNGRIEASSNLMDWVTLTNFVGTNAILHFHDPSATNPGHRFYRAVTP